MVTNKTLGKTCECNCSTYDKNATIYSAKHDHKYSRSPYEQSRLNRHHNYPCKMYLYSRDNKKLLISNETVNSMKEKKDKDTGEYSEQNRRYSFRIYETD